MDYYYYIITIIDVFVLGIMCVLTKCNEMLSLKQKYWLIATFVLISVISLLEMATVIVDDTPAKFRWLNIATNYLGFGLTPVVPVFLSFTLKENKANKKLIIAEIVYMALLAVSIPFGAVFNVDADNHYTRGDFFEVYVAAFCISTIYLLVSTVRIAGKYQNRGRNSVFLIVAFMLLCSMIQIAFPHVRISWFCVSFLAIVYSVYCNIMWLQLDGLTGLLNQNSFLNKTIALNRDMIMIVFDIDDFKQINDNCGHSTGDRCLKETAACIKKAYSKDGLCYRIGGDEFCVLLNVNADKEKCDEALVDELNARRKLFDKLPYVSFGSALFKAGDNADRVKEFADRNMYQMKRKHKNKQAE